jgi:cytidylate kinase
MTRLPVIAIDGPAGSGKSTTARAVARSLGFTHIDSGALYRTLTLIALEKLGADGRAWRGDVLAALAAEQGIRVVARGGEYRIERLGKPVGDEIRSDAVNREVSRVAAMRPVRDFVNVLLRAAAAGGGVVMDGRDIGTAVFPDAEIKVFLVADAEERARRRLAERGRPTDEKTVRAEAGALEKRDQHDMGREADPLLCAPDAVVIDTTRLDFADQVEAVLALVRKRKVPLDVGKGRG